MSYIAHLLSVNTDIATGISENNSELWEKLAQVLYSRQKMTAFVS